MKELKDYTTHLDSKKRITLRGAKYNYYNVKEYVNGCILLQPQELHTVEISSRTLKMMDSAIDNFRLGNVSDPVDLSGFEEKD